MSEQQATANTPSEPRLCKMGCGFFGSGATEDCCSKCWRELQKKHGNDVAASPKPEPAKKVEEVVAKEEPVPMDVEPEVEAEQPAPSDVAPVKKKKKKTSYKAMMAAMKASTDRDVEQEKESLRKVTGGGAFSKIDKI